MGARDAGAFIDLWSRATGPEARQYLREQPMEALRLAEEGKKTPRLDRRVGLAGQVVLDRLLAMEQSSLRIVERLRRGVEAVSSEGAEPVLAGLGRAEERSAVAFDAVRQWAEP